MTTLLYYYPGFFGIDMWYLILIVPCLLLSLFAQSYVKSQFRKYSEIMNRRGMDGHEAALRILRENDVNEVRVERTPGYMTDHYSHKEKVLRLSEPVYGERSIAAIGVAAHEAGHAIQYSQNYLPGIIRQNLYPVARIGSAAGPYLAIFGLMLNSQPFFTIGIILYAAAVLFYLVTLPVEFDASLRAVKILGRDGYLESDELAGVKSVLRAAALTYIASAATAFASLLRLILLNRNNRD